MLRRRLELESPEHEFRNAIPPGSQRPDLDSDSLRIDECSVVVFQQPASALNGSGVVDLNGKWYDVRSLTAEEVDAFLEDLLRADMASLEAGRMTPH